MTTTTATILFTDLVGSTAVTHRTLDDTNRRGV
jgi:class 3 adenylate cyclase